MSAFAFNFSIPGADSSSAADAAPSAPVSTTDGAAGTADHAARAHIVPDLLAPGHFRVLPFAPQHVDLCRTAPLSGAPSLLQVLVEADEVTGHARDVVHGVYEGGAKTWESTADIIAFLGANPGVTEDATVLDLGCGTGMAGIAALKQGARAAVFQDLNDDVLGQVTTANICVNIKDAGPKVSLLAADWSCMAAALQKGASRLSPDGPGWLAGGTTLVLSSETVYKPATYPTILALLRAVLHPTLGRALFAGKRFYFGAELGGGTSAFKAAAEAAGFRCALVHSTADGASMIRDIVELRLE